MKIKPFPSEISEEEKQEIFGFLKERFGFEQTLFEDFLILKGATNFWLFPKTNHLSQLKKLSPEAVGLLFLRRVSHYLKPTSSFLQRFGKWATKNVVTLNPEQVKLLREKGKIEIKFDLEPGYVILRNGKWILGCGLYVPGKLISYLKSL